jgi:hypothetical protein
MPDARARWPVWSCRPSRLTRRCGLLLLAAIALPGCYERVVRARGPGAERVRVQDPYQQNYEVDQWIFGEPAGGTPKTR